MRFPLSDGTLYARRKRDGQPMIQYRLVRNGQSLEGEVEVKMPHPLGLKGRDYILAHIEKENGNGLHNCNSA